MKDPLYFWMSNHHVAIKYAKKPLFIRSKFNFFLRKEIPYTNVDSVV